MKIKGSIISLNTVTDNNISVTTVVFKNAKGKKVEYEIHYDSNDNTGSIIRNGIDYAGLWFENGKLTDYDMVFELNKYAIISIRKAGLTVPRIFEPLK